MLLRKAKTSATRALLALAALAALPAVCVIPGFAAPQQPAVAENRGLSDPRELEDFLGSLLAEASSRWHVPGTVFVVVKDGRVFFARGYGFADWERHTPVSPETTVFRVGSISKVFTATAAMQLVEQGKLDLNQDINRYLKTFQVPENYPRPVTLAELLTHTGGFDDRAIGICARSPRDVVPLGLFLARRLPPRVMPPGEIYSYSNFGMALAGYLVESASGEPFDRYVAEHILEPLGMNHTSFDLTPELATNLATGYVHRDKHLVRVPADYFNLAPAMGLNTTGLDMARFMIAHLDGGADGAARILQTATEREMEAQHFTPDPRLPGRAYGFYVQRRNGLHIVGHGGNIRGYGSVMFLLPEQSLGVFMSSNLDDTRFAEEIEKKFLDHYFPVPPRESQAGSAESIAEARRYAGTYRGTPYSRTTLEKLVTLYWQFRVSVDPDGALRLHSPGNYEPPTRWVNMGSGLFSRFDDQNLAVFHQDARGRVTAMVTRAGDFERMPWYETAGFQVPMVKTLMLILLTGCAAWPLGLAISLWRRRLREAFRLPALAWLMAGIAGALVIYFLVGWVTTLRHMDLWEFTYGLPPYLHRLLYIPPVTTTLTAAMVVFAALAWKRRYWSIWGRCHFTAVTLAALAFVWFLLTWNLLGFRS